MVIGGSLSQKRQNRHARPALILRFKVKNILRENGLRHHFTLSHFHIWGVLFTIMRFSEVKRERFLTALEAGRGVDASCEMAGIARSTVERLRAKGRQAGGDAGAAEFASRFDSAARVRRATPPEVATRPLTDAELEAVLEDAARRGSAESAKALLIERRSRESEAEPPDELPTDGWSKVLRGDRLVGMKWASQPARAARAYPEITPAQVQTAIDLTYGPDPMGGDGALD
jgi:hypothetical protein